MMNKSLIGVAGVSTILISCVSCTSIPETLYYKAMTEKYNPINYADTLVITGTKPKELKLKAFVFLKGCDDFNYKREYNFESDDLGNEYKIEVPVIVRDTDKCKQISSFGIEGFWENGYRIDTIYPIRINNKNDDSLDYNNATINIYCFSDKNGEIDNGCDVMDDSIYKKMTTSKTKLNATNSLNINVLKGKHWDQVSSWAIEKK